MTSIATSAGGPPVAGLSLAGRIVAVAAAERSLGSGIACPECHDRAKDGTLTESRQNEDGDAVHPDAPPHLTRAESLGSADDQGTSFLVWLYGW
jgi:hypothetical protein